MTLSPIELPALTTTFANATTPLPSLTPRPRSARGCTTETSVAPAASQLLEHELAGGVLADRNDDAVYLLVRPGRERSQHRIAENVRSPACGIIVEKTGEFALPDRQQRIGNDLRMSPRAGDGNPHFSLVSGDMTHSMQRARRSYPPGTESVWGCYDQSHMPHAAQPPRLKICHVVATTEGASWVFEQLRGLRDRYGHDVAVVLNGASGALVDRFRAEAIRVHVADFDFTSSPDLLGLPRKVLALARLFGANGSMWCRRICSTR